MYYELCTTRDHVSDKSHYTIFAVFIRAVFFLTAINLPSMFSAVHCILLINLVMGQNIPGRSAAAASNARIEPRLTGWATLLFI